MNNQARSGPPRDANFSDEQHALAEVAGQLFAEVNPPSRIRQLWDAEAPRDRSVWRRLADMALLGIGIPEEFGGSGGNAEDLVMVLEQAGRNLLPEPLALTVAVAVPVLQSSEGGVAARWLPLVADGSATATLSLAGEPHVLDIDDAELVLVEREKTLWLETTALSARRVRAEDGSRRLFERPELRGQMLGGADLLADARRRAAAATAAELVGLCTSLLEACLAHVRVRQQFGVAVGSFQAVQHLLADMFVLLESARGAVRHAARQIAHEGEDRDVAASIAKASAARAHRVINANALQLLGGIGFTWEHDLHLWLKRGLALEAQHGGEREHRRAIAAALFD